MKGYYYLKFSDLTEEAQEKIMDRAIDELDGDELREEAKDIGTDYDILLYERAERHIYSFNYVFNM